MKMSDNNKLKPIDRRQEKPVPSTGSVGGKAPIDVKFKKKMTPVTITIIVVASLLVLVVATLGFLVWNKYNNINQDIDRSNQMYPTGTSSTVDNGEAQSSEPIIVDDTPEEVDPVTGVIPDFNELKNTNKDTIGHIRIPGTKMETPVVQGKDNGYYLNHNFFGNSALGVPFLDYRATLTQDYVSNNLTIYGHSASNGTYFAALKDFRSADAYKKNPLVYFDSIYGKGIYKVFGAFLCKVYTEGYPAQDPEYFNYHEYTNMTEEDFDAYMGEVAKRSYFTTDVDVAYGDQILTLSTCDDQIDSAVGTPYRMVVVARKVRGGESTEVNVDAAENNASMVMPSAWVQKNKKDNPFK